MSVHIYRYGEGGGRRPGLSIGVTRHGPRGVRREVWAREGYFDVWLPLLAPSRELLGALKQGAITFARFSARYRAEMRRPEPRQVIRMLAAVARRQRINLGCFCADPARCHRTLLRELIENETTDPEPRERRESGEDASCGREPGEETVCASPPCFLLEIED